MPSIVDAMPAGGMAALLADPASRTAHVDAIARFAADGDYDGIDIDYEQFAFADGRDTWAATRPNWVAFITELGDRLHADGRTLTVSIPPIYDTGQTADSGYWVYDYGAIAPHVDHIRIMAYDYSVDEPGPIAPSKWVESAIKAALDATQAPDKLVLGLPAYGRNWPTAVSGECPADLVEGRTSVTAATVDDLMASREATPVFVAGDRRMDLPVRPRGVRRRHLVRADPRGALRRRRWCPRPDGSRPPVPARRGVALGVRLR